MSTELDNIFKEYYKVEYIPISDKLNKDEATNK